MPRCTSCNGIIAKDDVKCYVCGDQIPGRSSFSLARWWRNAEKKAPAKTVTRVVGDERPVSADPLRP